MNQVALITGASRGIGRGIALELATAVRCEAGGSRQTRKRFFDRSLMLSRAAAGGRKPSVGPLRLTQYN